MEAMIQGRVGSEDVLLGQRGERFFAVGAYCTHYHGSLCDGLLVGDTLRCPSTPCLLRRAHRRGATCARAGCHRLLAGREGRRHDLRSRETRATEAGRLASCQRDRGARGGFCPAALAAASAALRQQFNPPRRRRISPGRVCGAVPWRCGRVSCADISFWEHLSHYGEPMYAAGLPLMISRPGCRRNRDQLKWSPFLYRVKLWTQGPQSETA